MNIIVNNTNGFSVVLSQQVGYEHDNPEYNTKFAVSITPSRQVGNFNGKLIRCQKDVFYVDSWTVAMNHFKDLENYAIKNKA